MTTFKYRAVTCAKEKVCSAVVAVPPFSLSYTRLHGPAVPLLDWYT